MHPNPSGQPLLYGEVLFDCFDDGSRVLGGAPFNVAWHLQGFGLQPTLISRVGDDPSGHQVRQQMQHWGLGSAGLQLDSRHPTGSVQVSLHQGQPSYDIVTNRAWDHIQADALPPLQPSLIYHGSLALRSADSAASLASLCARHAEVPRYFDVNLRPPWWNAEQIRELIAQARWLKINDEELHSLVPGDAALEEKAARLLREHDLQVIILTRGAAGALWLDRQNPDQPSGVQPEAQLAVVDSVGAGDAFAAVSLLGIQLGWAAPLILQRAQQFASLIVGQRGATAFDPELYRCLCQGWGLTHRSQSIA